GEADGSDNPADVIAIMITAPVAPRLSAAAQQQWRIRRAAGGSLPQQRCEPNPYRDRATFQHLPRAVARAAFARARYPQPRFRRVGQIDVRDLYSRHLRWSRAGRRRDLDHEPESAIMIISGRDDAADGGVVEHDVSCDGRIRQGAQTDAPFAPVADAF